MLNIFSGYWLSNIFHRLVFLHLGVYEVSVDEEENECKTNGKSRPGDKPENCNFRPVLFFHESSLNPGIKEGLRLSPLNIFKAVYYVV